MWQYEPERAADVVQDFIDYALNWLDARGYTLTVDVDMMRWASVIEGTSPGAFVNPVFDPRHSRLFPETNFWLDVKAGSQTIATTAERLFVTDDVLDLLRSMRLWLAEPPAEYGQLAVSLPPGSPEIGGIVGHEGGVWVHPQHRKRGLSVILPHLSTALARREWDIDWQTGIVRGTLGDCGMATWAYGFAHVEPCFEGYFPLTRSDDRFYFCYMNREELTAGLNLDVVARLLPDRHQQPRHASALVEKR